MPTYTIFTNTSAPTASFFLFLPSTLPSLFHIFFRLFHPSFPSLPFICSSVHLLSPLAPVQDALRYGPHTPARNQRFVTLSAVLLQSYTNLDSPGRARRHAMGRLCRTGFCRVQRWRFRHRTSNILHFAPLTKTSPLTVHPAHSPHATLSR